MSGALRLKTLGELRLEGPAGEVRSLRRQERILLAYLARRAGSPVRRAELAALLWGARGEARARQSLRQALFSLRRLLGEALAVGAETVRLEQGAVELDLNALEEEVRQGRPAEALTRWGGDFLAGLADAGDEPLRWWIEAERVALRGLLAGALDALARETRSTGRWEELTALARRWAEANPWEEAAQARLVEVLQGAGYLEEAFAWHARALAHLRGELGVEPSAAFLRLGEELAEARARGLGAPLAVSTLDAALAAAGSGNGTGGEAVAPTGRGRAGRRRWLAFAALALIVLTGVAALMLFRGSAPAPVLAVRPGTEDPTAWALYEEALEAYYQHQDYPGALRLFTAALERDSSFAMAALYAAYSAGFTVRREDAYPLLQRAGALADHAPDRDRLFILAGTALPWSRALAAAETLAVRYPGDPSGPLLVAQNLLRAGRFLEAVTPLRDALARKPLAAYAPTDRCVACDAYFHLIDAYWLADSVPAAVRVAREWAALQPQNPIPRSQLAGLLDLLGHHAEAEAVRRQIATLRPENVPDPLWEAKHAIRAGDFAVADPALEYLARLENPTVAEEAVWLQVISLRNQGHYREAWRAATRLRAMAGLEGPPVHPLATPQAVVLLETGRGARAAAMFDSMFHALGQDGRPPPTARDQAWLLTLQGTALAAAGDTTRLARLADSVRSIGARSNHGRDPRLHHHIRGLLHRARGDFVRAEAEFRAAIFSTVGGYTRTNLELAQVLIQQGRPAEAIPLLEAALRAPLDGPALYVTRSELHLALGTALEAAGLSASAEGHYRRVLGAWGGADSAFTPRVEELRSRLTRLERRRFAAGIGSRR